MPRRTAIKRINLPTRRELDTLRRSNARRLRQLVDAGKSKEVHALLQACKKNNTLPPKELVESELRRLK
ncbi:MAG: hypothetical protein HOE11_00965 [Candidatus Diapherotrites archaeon]|jgi:hypothetical protein|nr:hypothetical protein [Candidatus Diapherotrites archaeon]MBT4596540.1 hypothetical protein [Candidatus Diapherotrites archaeon]